MLGDESLDGSSSKRKRTSLCGENPQRNRSTTVSSACLDLSSPVQLCLGF